MARVERGNVVLHIADEDIQRYLLLGYNVTDEQGNILNEALPTNLGVLQKHFVESKRKIAELEQQIAELEQTIVDLSTKLEKTPRKSKEK